MTHIKHYLKKIVVHTSKIGYKILDRKILNVPSITPSNTYSRLISIGGFGCSGHSALLDYLAEFDCITLIDRKFEIDFLRSAGGIFNLEDMIETKNLFIMDFAIKSLITSAEYNYQSGGIYTDKYMELTHDFINKITDIKTITPSGHEFSPAFIFLHESRPLGYKNLEKPFVANPNELGVIYHIKHMTKEQYRKLAKEYIHSFLQTIDSKPILIMNHLTSDFNEDLEWHKEYCGKSFKEIMVWRDPRDAYAELSSKNISWYPHTNVDEFINMYYMRIHNYIDAPHPDRLLIRFEDLVLKYDKTTKLILKYIGIEDAKPTKQYAFFNPEISKNNIGLWRKMTNQEDIKKIEDKLKEFCYYPQ